MPAKDSPSSPCYLKTKESVWMESHGVFRGSETSVFNWVRKREAWLILELGPVVLRGLVRQGQNAMINKLFLLWGFWRKRTCWQKPQNVLWQQASLKLGFIYAHHPKPHVPVTFSWGLSIGGSPRRLQSLFATSLTRLSLPLPPGTLHPRCLSTMSLPLTQWAAVTTARSPFPSAFTTWPPAMSTSPAMCYGATNTGTWPTNWQERTKVCLPPPPTLIGHSRVNGA